MKVVILAGGKGTRLAPYTNVFPKPLIPIGDMPILEVVIRQLKSCGFDEIILAVGYMADLLRAYCRDGERYGVKIDYSIEDSPLGTAGPLALIPGLENTFIVMNGDVLTTLDYRDLVQFHKRKQAVATIAMYRRLVKIDLGVIQCNGYQEVIGYIEKPVYHFTVSMGIYVFEPRVLHYIEPREYLDFPDLVVRLLDHKERVVAYPYDGYWLDIGRLDDYQQAVEEFEKMRPHLLYEAKG